MEEGGDKLPQCEVVEAAAAVFCWVLETATATTCWVLETALVCWLLDALAAILSYTLRRQICSEACGLLDLLGPDHLLRTHPGPLLE
ncbi:hypothetical protein WJX81_000938 [Elliptochloris bilobata]|uniref:Uncharacterized protein n=1 Tax=Elliptochloris bilobata TaxID=381761 RepID=A0AAW1RVW3_9CHLO